ncbi:MAG: hypothetical protein GX555_07055 [Actinomycetales bacterium]|nr:hypothetical protein [Actinomycetales bacterium]
MAFMNIRVQIGSRVVSSGGPGTVRISDEAERALQELTADGTSRSDAVQQALLDAVALRQGRALGESGSTPGWS